MINTVPLGEVADVAMGSAPPGHSYNETGEGLPMIAGAGDYGEKYPCPHKWTTAPTRVAEVGDLIVCVRATIGDLNWADKQYCLGRGVAGLRAKEEKLDIKYAAHYIKARKHDLAYLGTGSTFLAIRRNDLEEFPIPLPPLEEQKRIAAILDTADAIRHKRQQTIKLADDFLRATFLYMFGDPVTNPKGWNTAFLKQVGKVSTGATPSSTKEGMFGRDVPFITPGDLNDNKGRIARYVTKEGAQNSRTVRKGATLVCCIGATIGKVDITKSLVAFNQQINAVEWNETINDIYGFWAMRFLKKLIIDRAINTTLPILKKSEFELINIPVPPAEIQTFFAQQVKHSLKMKQKQNVFHEKSMEFFNSLTQRAFRGEL